MTQKMKLYPFKECSDTALQHRLDHRNVNIYQQWLCAHCGIKQTMGEPNIFYTSGRCEECNKITDIQRDGCNYMMHIRRKPDPEDDYADRAEWKARR